MDIKLVTEYWSNYLGVNLIDAKPSLVVVPHASLGSFHGAWVFRHNEKMIISVPKSMVGEIERRLSLIDQPYNLSYPFVKTLFSEKIERIIGPVYQGYYQSGSSAQIRAEVVKVDANHDRKRIAFLKRKDASGWEDSSIDKSLENLFGIEEGNGLVALATYRMVAPTTAFIGIFCDPSCRRKGYGRRVLSGIVHHLVEREYLIIYQTLMSNIGSIKVAQAVGFVPFAQNFAIRFK